MGDGAQGMGGGGVRPVMGCAPTMQGPWGLVPGLGCLMGVPQVMGGAPGMGCWVGWGGPGASDGATGQAQAGVPGWGQAHTMQPTLPQTAAPAVTNLQWPLSVATVQSWRDGSAGSDVPNLITITMYCNAMPAEVPSSAARTKAVKIDNILLFLQKQPGQSWSPPAQL